MDPHAHPFVHYLPLLTTTISVVYSVLLFRKFMARKSPHLFWWAFGIACYGSGTVVESLITLFGNTVLLNQLWYVTGALLGGYPLAQGSVYLSHSKKFGDRAVALTLPLVIVGSILVFVSPIHLDKVQAARPSGDIFVWWWIRLLTPVINLYASYFLIGGAAISAWKYFKKVHDGHRAAGNGLIALGALMPAIGGSLTKAGYVEALYVLECIGLILIWIGDRTCGQSSTLRAQGKTPAAS